MITVSDLSPRELTSLVLLYEEFLAKFRFNILSPANIERIRIALFEFREQNRRENAYRSKMWEVEVDVEFINDKLELKLK